MLFMCENAMPAAFLLKDMRNLVGFLYRLREIKNIMNIMQDMKFTKYENCFVAFIDLLGFSARVERVNKIEDKK